MKFLPWEIRVAFPGERQLRQSRATQPTVHAGCLSVFMIQRTLTWTTGSLTCAQMSIQAIAHGMYGHTWESALKADSWRKIPCRTGESNLRQRRAGPMLYQWATSPPQILSSFFFFFFTHTRTREIIRKFEQESTITALCKSRFSTSLSKWNPSRDSTQYLIDGSFRSCHALKAGLWKHLALMTTFECA